MLKKIIGTGIVASSFLLTTIGTHAETISLHKTLWDDEAQSITLNSDEIDALYSTQTENVYRNFYMGFSMNYPLNWHIDKHQSEDYVRLYGDDFRIDITKEDLAKDYIDKDTYINETLEHLTNNITLNEVWKTSNDKEIKNVDYSRTPISGIANDLNYYSYSFVKLGDVLFTFQLKTNEPNFSTKKSELEALINTIEVFEPTVPNGNTNFQPDTNSPAIEYVEENKTLKIDSNKVAYGIYEPGNAGNIATRESELNTHFGAQMFYKPIDSNYDSYVDDMLDAGKAPLVTFHFDSHLNPNDDNTIINTINGDYDSYITSWAQGIKETKAPVFVRIGNEMNGQWVKWSHKNNYNDPDLYKLAYRHVVNIFNSNDTNNALFVWNPNNASKPDYNWNDTTLYYPGDDYVDWVGLTAYNFGKDEWTDFEYFDDLYFELYKKYMRAFPNKPMLIGEFASVELEGNKSHFIKDMFNKIPKKYPNIKLVIWFNNVDGEFNFPYDSTPESEFSFKEGLKHTSIVQYPVTKSLPSGLQLMTPNQSATIQSKWTFTGIAHNTSIKNLWLNDIKQTFKWATWRQFDETFELVDGVNKIDIKIEFKDGTFETYPYFIYKESSFKFSAPLSSTVTNAPIINKETMTITGLVKDKHISTMKINDFSVDIKWSWRQFDYPVNLQDGINEYVVKGFDTSGKEITSEKFYIFKDSYFRITSPSETFSDTFGFTRTITGLVPNNEMKWVKIDGIEQTLKWSWRQFDQALNLDYGDNSFYADAIYEGQINGSTVYYPLHKEYTIHAPSFEFTTDVSYVPSRAGQTSSDTTLIGGLIKDKKVQSMSINGEPVELLYEWKQFSHEVTLENGLNEFKIVGYSDANRTNQIVEETVYMFNNNDIIITAPKATKSNTLAQKVTFTGMVPNKKIKKVYINGVEQELKWSWRQFDHVVDLNKRGNNEIKIEAIYEDSVNGKFVQYRLKKVYTMHTPSFDFSVPVGYTISSAPQTSKSSQWIGGFVKDNDVIALKINGEETPIRYSWRQFDYTANLKSGLNAFVFEGYSDFNYENKLFEEIVFLFNDSGMVIEQPTDKNFVSDFKEVAVSGVLKYDFYKSITLNAEKLPFINEWRQFSTKVTLPAGENALNFEAVYKADYKGEPYEYLVKKTYVVTIPEGLSSYEFSTNVGKTPEEPAIVDNPSYWLGGYVKNGDIKSISINGEPTPIEYSWRQFSKAVKLKKGLNPIVITGYSDLNNQDVLEEETVYVYIDPVLLPDYKYVTPVGTFEEPAGTTDNPYWFGAMVKNADIKAVKVNGERVDIVKDWREFGRYIPLNAGKNEITIQGFADLEMTKEIANEIVYVYIAPENIINFEFTTPVGTSADNAPTTTSNKEWIGALVKNPNIKSVTVDGIPAEIMYSWRQISVGVSLDLGMNAINVIGYSDENYQNPIAEEIIYINRD